MLEILQQAVEKHASDLHISVNVPPTYRINGELITEGIALTPDDTESLAKDMMSKDEWIRFSENGELDFSYSVQGLSRFRVNVYRQRGCVSIAVRVVPNHVPSVEELALPASLTQLTEKTHGLVLVTGPTGSGKSTTLAALIDYLNHHSRKHIITLEDPIEYLHKHDLSIIDQREVGLDTKGFAPALRASLRQDPDVILVGEMRDLETISTAITAAETGHLVFATMHTGDAVQTIDRIVDVYPPGQQAQIRVQLAGVLQGVVAQKLVVSSDGKSRVAVMEILINTAAVANLIRTEKIHQIRSTMQTGKSYGMQTFDMHLKELQSLGKIAKTRLHSEFF
ncbi:type IV pilus twitching motility protein PilT [Alicyclobacillus sp. SO9]|uniref:type IV pilus twitching motility protein PilT n=1 Tax=Alicyclobacillus sp. SO9 TaxID=2665646 RepID=UPI0018E77ED8|nr:type IV pilus twitching motility protein PilT [Alicyclobacillus sp. SO9]QQE77692.1 type IV pilus twitching motility protein PilT [Alicyclobacillus sp. SO9]